MVQVNDTLVIETTTNSLKARIIYIHKRTKHLTTMVLDNRMLLTILRVDKKITAVLSNDGVLVDSPITNIKHYPCFFVIGQEYRIKKYDGYAKDIKRTTNYVGTLVELPFVRRIHTRVLKTIYNLEDFDLSDIPPYLGARDVSMIILRLTEGDNKGKIEYFATHAPPPADTIVSIEKVVRGGKKKNRKTKRNIK